MSSPTIRIFIGNLPSDITEDEIKEKVNKYANVSSVELKHRNDGVFAFIDIRDTQTKLDHCFNQLSSKCWKGHKLRVQKAKESFLQRLAKERMENVNLPSKQNLPIQSPNITHFNNSPCNAENARKKLTNVSDSTCIRSSKFDKPTVSSSESSDTDTPRKASLRMFSGTNAAFKNQVEGTVPNEKGLKASHCMLTNKLNEEKRILQKFESFDSVWKDSSSNDDECSPPPTCLKRGSRQNTKLNRVRLDHIVHKKANVNIVYSETTDRTVHHMNINADKSQESEKKRLKAIDDRQRELVKRKQAVNLALASVDRRSNKKIIFEDNDQEDLQATQTKSHKNGKLILFNDDEMECGNEYNDDFRIRNQFEGQKGQSLFKLQNRYGNDKRFTLDERFIESDDDDTERGSHNHNYEFGPKGEQEKVHEILEDVLGKDMRSSSKAKAKYIAQPMLRYDPTKPTHVKFELKKNLEDKTKKIKVDQNDESCGPRIEDVRSIRTTRNNPKAFEETLPVVTKEKFYNISDTLQESLQNKEQKFSLLEMFGDVEEEEKEKVENVPFTMKPISKKIDWSVDQLKGHSSEEEENSFELRDTAHNKNNHGVRQESLFFEKNDDRLIEGLNYVQYNNEFIERFNDNRRGLRDIIRRKVMNNKKRAQQWKTKLGGGKRNPNSSSKPRHGVKR